MRVISLKRFGPCHLPEQKENLVALFQRVKCDIRTVLQHQKTLPAELGPQRQGLQSWLESRADFTEPGKRHFSELSNFWKETQKLKEPKETI